MTKLSQTNILAFAFFITSIAATSFASAGEKYLRFEHDGKAHFGILNGQMIDVLLDGIFPMSSKSGEQLALADVSLLPPTQASKVFAVGMNFASHMSSQSDAPPPLFLKLPTSLIGHDAPILVPEDATNVHFEGELVLVIGKSAKNVSIKDAPDYIFGVTAGNDLTERSWQGRDLQWMRAKAADGFGPVGPVVATDIDYNNVLLTTRLNGDIVQQENTENMIHKPSKVLSYLSQYFTLLPGDLIFMGTPGRTQALDDGDVVSVEIEGVGMISNEIKR